MCIGHAQPLHKYLKTKVQKRIDIKTPFSIIC